ncbi:MAG: hypothetical protein ACLGIN_04565 [Candidatus Sericytochromatia bacterium]
MEDLSLSLYDVSARLGVSPSATKKRVANLNIPVQRGARGKMIFDAQAFALLSQADELLKAGHDFETCRRQLGLGQEETPIVEAPEVEAIVEAAPAEEPPVDEAPPVAEEAAEEEPEVLTHVVAKAETPPVEVAAIATAPEAPAEAPEPRPTPGMRTLPTPVMIQLGRRKAEQASQPAGAQAPDPQERELLTRLDKALKLMEEKEKQNQTLQAKLLVAYDEMTKLSATAAAFQERSLNLQHEVSKLQSELRLLTAPEENRPWWKFWG